MKDNKIEFSACAPPACRCPQLKSWSGTVWISDDYGNEIKCTSDEMDILARKWLEERNEN
jgi:hypothetical protein